MCNEVDKLYREIEVLRKDSEKLKDEIVELKRLNEN
jgi:hypothetical protein